MLPDPEFDYALQKAGIPKECRKDLDWAFEAFARIKAWRKEADEAEARAKAFKEEEPDITEAYTKVAHLLRERANWRFESVEQNLKDFLRSYMGSAGRHLS